MGNEKILIVEDEAIIAYELKLKIEEHGYRVVSIGNTAEEAIEMTAKYRPDLILMDVMLQGAHDGIYAAEKAQSLYPVPVVFITGNTRVLNDPRLNEVERHAMLVKPPSDDVLFSTLESILGR